MPENFLAIVFSAIIILLLVILIVLTLQKKSNKDDERLVNELNIIKDDLLKNVNYQMKGLGDILASAQTQTSDIQDKRLQELLRTLDRRLAQISEYNEKKLEQMRTTVDEKLEQMRMTVDEKLQKTLEERLGQSFKLVSEQLNKVHAGLGEMQNLATGVGDLKKVLSNVKTRGILGEIQLGAILEEILSAEQYEENVALKIDSRDRVEFAVKLPGDDKAPVYLPIDAKFPADKYNNLMDSYETADKEKINSAWIELERSLKLSAKTIKEKYIEPPITTDFAVMFLPTEGLYAEAVNRNMVEILQREYKVVIAGPTTMAALLNSLQMGFKTLAIKKRSSEVWEVLGSVKTEFEKFGAVLEAAQKKINMANKDLDDLIGVRTRQIQRKLQNVSMIDGDEDS